MWLTSLFSQSGTVGYKFYDLYVKPWSSLVGCIILSVCFICILRVGLGQMIPEVHFYSTGGI